MPTPKNLQFFPKDMTGQQILPIMQNFNAALGVNCTYCHNAEPPVDRPGNDFASDEKETKKKARVMLVMARDVNMKLQSELGKPANELTNVQCVTCHRGVAIPKQLVAIMMETAGKEGVNKAVAAVSGPAQAVLRRAGVRLQRRDALQRGEPVAGRQQAR